MEGLKADIAAHVLTADEKHELRVSLADVYYILAKQAGTAYWRRNDWLAHVLREAAEEVKALHAFVEASDPKSLIPDSL